MKHALLVSLFLQALTAWASSPSSPAPRDAAEAYAKSSRVFLGTVEEVGKDTLGFLSQAKVKVTRVWKENLPSSVKVSGAGGSTYPARVFEKGSTYLFYLGDDFHADAATDRVLTLDQASSDLRALAKLVPDHGQGTWRTCSSRQDCTVVEGICGGWDVVASRFSDALRQHNQERNTSSNCAPRTTPKPSVDCVNRNCRAITK